MNRKWRPVAQRNRLDWVGIWVTVSALTLAAAATAMWLLYMTGMRFR